MKVLVVSQYFWPEDFRINDLVFELNKRGHNITILTGKPNYPTGKIHSDFKRNPKKYNSFYGVNVVRIPIFLRSKGHLRLLINYASFVFSGLIFGTFFLRKKNLMLFLFMNHPL